MISPHTIQIDEVEQAVNLWHIDEESFDPKKMHSQETIYTIGNGYFATRGTFEENYVGANPGTLLYGVFDDISIGKEELANIPDWLPIQLFINGERFHMNRGKILAYHRTLDMRNGVLTRTVYWQSPGGIRLKIQSERFASLADEHVGAIRYSVTVEEKPLELNELKLLLRATFNMAVGNYDLMHWEPVEEWHEDDLVWLLSQTRHSAVQLLQTMDFTTQAPGFSREIFDSNTAPSIELEGKLTVGETITAEKIVVMYTTHDVTDPVMAAFRHHWSFGFWKAALIFGRSGSPRNTQDDAMGQFGRISSILDLPKEKVLIGYIKEAVRINEAGLKAPARHKPKTKQELAVPDDLLAALKKNKKALMAFENFSYSRKQEYVEWVTEAKREETRKRRLETALEWMAQGKPRYWKYA